MKAYLPLIIAATLLTNQHCGKRNVSGTCYKGRLEVKGICGNYTIGLLEGGIDTANLVTTWKDDVTGKTYTNVFALASPCPFPDSIAAGDEFYFTLDDTKSHCNVCLAYYPTPQKKLSVKVLDKPCN